MKMIEWLTSKLPDRAHVRSIIFGMNTPTGRLFDILLLCLILLSVIVVSAESTVGLSHSTRNFLHWCEWVITIVFTIEYILRIYCLHKPWRYILSFYGIIDLISILPSYIALIYSGAQVLMVFRILRLLRIFRILSLNNLVSAGDMLVRSIRASMAKIMVFMLFLLLLVTILGSVMYLIEGRGNPNFSSIPKSIYWAIVTLTTVGYGDITPVTTVGQLVSTIVMLLGYSIIAVPTGIISAEMTKSNRTDSMVAFDSPIRCPRCNKRIRRHKARYCDQCGYSLFTHGHTVVPNTYKPEGDTGSNE